VRPSLRDLNLRRPGIQVPKSRSLALSLLLLWLVGVAMRLTILAVPPVIPALRANFNLSGTDIGLLTGLPVILFAAAALAGSRLVSRVGAVTAACVGLVLTALGSALRAVAPDVLTLFAATIVMGGGVAITQPAAPALVARWLPDKIGLGTGVYTNGLIVGEILPVALFPLLFPLLGGSWRATFVLWAIPIAAIAIFLIAAAPREDSCKVYVERRWWPAVPLRDVLRWGFTFASASALYYATNAFLPGHLIEAGRSDLINPALTALNFGQLPASLALIAFSRRLERKAWPFVVSGLISLGCLALIVASNNTVAVIAATGVLGFAIGAAFALCLTLPPLLSPPREVARVAAAMFTITYASTMVISVLSGIVWDFVGVERFAFLPIALAALPLLLLAPTIRFDYAPSPPLEPRDASA
jgi:MFS transporter, CP family, cyanate transporter